MSDKHQVKQEQNAGDSGYYDEYNEREERWRKNENKTVMDGVPRSRGFSVVALVLAIISVILCPVFYLGLAFGTLALVFSIISRRNLGYFDGFSIAGLVLSIFGLVFSVFSIIVNIYLISNPEIIEALFSFLEEALGKIK